MEWVEGWAKTKRKLDYAKGVLDAAISGFKPVAIFALFSGGHDSLTSTHFAASHLGERLTGVAHINTGFGIGETRRFVRQTCVDMGWRLLEYKAIENTKADGSPDPMIYRELVLKHGFPGPQSHKFMYQYLKERQLRRLIRDYKKQRTDKIMLISGVRFSESSRRMGNIELLHQEGASIWVSPLAEFESIDQQRYMAQFSLPENPVKKLLCMSGECLCGAFARKNELEEIRLWFPKTAARIDRLNEEVLAAGHKHKWGEWKPKDRMAAKNDLVLPLCVSCPSKIEEE